MPLYQIEHICHLADSQQDTLAEAITGIHTEVFTAPSLFVNVTFTNISSQRTYVAGKRVSLLIYTIILDSISCCKVVIKPMPTQEHKFWILITAFSF